VSHAYPYPDTPLLPQWQSRKAQAQGAFAFVAAALATLIAPLGTSPHAIALLIVLPAALSFILAFAPDPSRPTSRLTKDLFVAGAALAVFAGPYLGFMVASAPLGLVVGVAVGEGLAWYRGRAS
jgi:hypothetical protein